MMYMIWNVIQVLIGIHFLLPVLLLIIRMFEKKRNLMPSNSSAEADYAIIVTAYQQTHQLPAVVASLLKLNYNNYLVYIVADDCDVSSLLFPSDRIILLRPPEVLASNVRSHFYAIQHFRREHERLTIIDSDNLTDPEYLNELSVFFDGGFNAVQGVRKAKNLSSTYACLDEAGDIYYRYVDRKLMFEAGSSSALSGSGMAFTTHLYRKCLENNPLQGAGFDKLLQYELVDQDEQIAFAEKAVVYDEKTSKTDQLVRQRSRWINTWFRFFYLGVKLFFGSIKRFNKNQFLFSLQLLRPPLFILVGLSGGCVLADIWLAPWALFGWLLAGGCFITLFFCALGYFKADKRIYSALKQVPRFIYYQLQALIHAKRANKLSVATQHYEDGQEYVQ